MLKTQKDKKLENFFSSNNKTKKKKNIIVGLSGGVDSSLSAALLVERGWNVEGLTLWLMKGQGSCCSEGLVDAAGLCEDLGINHKIIDSREIFEREVIKKTTESYEKGFTPLPCSMCNMNVKFEEMLRRPRHRHGEDCHDEGLRGQPDRLLEGYSNRIPSENHARGSDGLRR